MSVIFPIDYNAVRAAFVSEIQRVTQVPCILEEATTQNAPRPTNPGSGNPYFSFKLTTPGAKSGDDSSQYTGDGTIYNRGGVRKMSISFHCYAREQEDAYNLMALWQGSLELFAVQNALKAVGVAVWIIGNVADMSALLDTGYEGRAHMDCDFGIASNINEDLGQIDTTIVTGEVDTNQGIVDVGPFDVSAG